MSNIEKNLDPKLSFYDSAKLVNEEHWNAVVDGKSVYLSLAFLDQEQTIEIH